MIDNLDTKEAMRRIRAIEEALAPFEFKSDAAKDIAATNLLERVSVSVLGQGFLIDGLPLKTAVRQELAGGLSFCIAPKSTKTPAFTQDGGVPVGGLAVLKPEDRRAVIAATFKDRRRD